MTTTIIDLEGNETVVENVLDFEVEGSFVIITIDEGDSIAKTIIPGTAFASIVQEISPEDVEIEHEEYTTE